MNTSEVIVLSGANQNGSHVVNPPPGEPITHYDGGRVTSFLLDGRERSDWSVVGPFESHRAPVDVASADVDGDGTMEVAVLTGFNRAPETRNNYIDSPQVTIRNADGSERLDSSFSISDFTGPFVPIAIAAGDVDADGQDEIVVLTGRNSDPSTNLNAVISPRVHIFEADGTPVPNTGFSVADIFSQSPAPISVAVGNVGGSNALPEIIVLTGNNTDPGSADNYVTGARVRSYEPDGTPIPDADFTATGSPGADIAPIDIAVVDQAVGTRRIGVLIGNNGVDTGFDTIRYVTNAMVGVYDAVGTQFGSFFNAAVTVINGIPTARQGVRGMGLVAANCMRFTGPCSDSLVLSSSCCSWRKQRNGQNVLPSGVPAA